MAKLIVINQHECIGCETCVELCPSAFRFNENEEKAYVIEGADPDEECVQEAIDSCPASCIYIE